jgi:hypothetical protein
LVDRYDKNSDGHLDFYDFADIFAPYTEGYRKALFERGKRAVNTYKDYTIQTQRLMKDLLKSLGVSLVNFEISKDKVAYGDILLSNDLFDYLDKFKVRIKFIFFELIRMGLLVRRNLWGG